MCYFVYMVVIIVYWINIYLTRYMHHYRLTSIIIIIIIIYLPDGPSLETNDFPLGLESLRMPLQCPCMSSNEHQEI